MAAKLHGQLIDREHPLWEFYVFDGIKAPQATWGIEGKLVGFYSKIHHAALDGKGGTVLANAVLDFSPSPAKLRRPTLRARAARAGDLKIGEMIGAVFSNSLAQYAKLARSLPAAATSLGGAVARQSVSGGEKGLKPAAEVTDQPGAQDAFQRRHHAAPRLRHRQRSVRASKAMAKVAGGSFNDIVLWICSTALRNYLASTPRCPRSR